MRHAFLIAAMAALAAGAFAQEPAMPSAQTDVTQQTDIAVTAYNSGIALVRDVRKLDLPQGEVELKFMDVAQQIRPETVGLRSLAQAGSVVILEQNYEYDLISPEKLMEKYVGKEVKLINFSNEIGFFEKTAELLSINQGPVYRVDGQIFLGHPGNVVVPELPDNLIAKPSLIWHLNNTLGAQQLEATYITNGISWRADYVLTLAKTDSSLDIAGWVTMDNQSGATYENARLKLVAGDVNIAPPQVADKGMRERALAMSAPAPEMAREETFAEYHLYTIPRRTTIKQNQSKQVALLSGAGVQCEKRYEFRGMVDFYSNRFPPMKDQHVDVFLKFQNTEANHLGIPVPAGIMRIYQEDSEGMLQFAGEDRVDHTPKDEEIRLRMGKAFDVVADRIQKDFAQISDRVCEAEFEITVRNHKGQDVVVDIVEPMPADWKILSKSHDFVKKDAHTAIFSVPVPKDGKVAVTYRVQVQY
ncbi:MAG TPA: DUF4139 domain-containing protein [Candidatus Hydrogenedentes bacterium]|nr:DUF4139 domain-containing protein [Candidatus Hydrogenedentota bacterium]HPV36412.1 DUF4139 domain-containing protein [Candidatus Hydrogenedentota bacterium]